MKNIFFDLCAIPIFMIILFATFIRKATKGLTNKVFIISVVTAFLTTLADLAMEWWAGTVPLTPNQIRFGYVMSYIYFVLRNILAVFYLYFLFVITRTAYRFRRFKVKGLVLIPYFILLAVLFQNLFTHNVFVITAEEGYQRKGMLTVLYLISTMYAGWGLAHLIRYRKFLNFGKWSALISMYVLSFFAIFIQLFLPRLMVEMYATSIVFLLVVMLVLRPEEISDSAVNLPSFQAYKTELEKVTMTKQKVQIIVIRFVNANDVRTYLGEELYYNYVVKVADQISKLAQRKHLSYEMFFERPGTIYFMLDNMDFDAKGSMSTLYQEVRDNTKNFSDTGAKFIPRICVIKYPEDMDNYYDILHFGQEFHGLIPYEQVFSLASDIVGSRDFEIKSNIDSILNRAITGKKLEMYYQPIYSFKEKRFISAEALIRLNDRVYGFIAPGLFIPAAESRGLILPIGDFVLESVHKFIAENDLKALGLSYIEINLSVAQCLQNDLSDKIKQLRKKYGVTPEKVNLEITETTYDNIGEVMDQNLQKLSSVGYTFSLDDYGTGYSNIQRVSKLPLKIVKIDKSLIDDMGTPDGMTILENTVKMMKGIHKELVVEGVETKEALDKLEELGCDFIQGFYFSKPLPEKQFLEFLKNHNVGRKEAYEGR